MNRVLADALSILAMGAGVTLALWCWLFTGPDWGGSDPEARESTREIEHSNESLNIPTTNAIQANTSGV